DAVAGGGRGRRRGRSVPLDHLLRFFEQTGGRFFPPRDFADFISPPGRAARRDKLAYLILQSLVRAGLARHNGASSQAARYKLDDRFYRPPGPGLAFGAGT
ncbi:MAG: hypothetical protein AB1896_21180, partial [Thermodesulfobacteriota bacterium]